jgi:hypothetical protein
MADDPWGLLGLEFPSKCCPGEKSKIVVYDHTGAATLECECGNQYWHEDRLKRSNIKGPPNPQ